VDCTRPKRAKSNVQVGTGICHLTARSIPKRSASLFKYGNGSTVNAPSRNESRIRTTLKKSSMRLMPIGRSRRQKLLRDIRGLGLSEAKEVVDAYARTNPDLLARRRHATESGVGRLVVIGLIAAALYMVYRLLA